MLVWEKNDRFYCALIERDLLGDVVVSRCWGGRESGKGGMTFTLVPSVEAGAAELHRIARRRAARRYKLQIPPALKATIRAH